MRAFPCKSDKQQKPGTAPYRQTGVSSSGGQIVGTPPPHVSRAKTSELRLGHGKLLMALAVIRKSWPRAFCSTSGVEVRLSRIFRKTRPARGARRQAPPCHVGVLQRTQRKPEGKTAKSPENNRSFLGGCLKGNQRTRSSFGVAQAKARPSDH